MFRWKGKEIKDMDLGKFSRNSLAYFTLGLAILAMTFFGVCSPDQATNALTGAAAKVDGETVSAMDFRRAYSRQYEDYQQKDPEGVEAGKYDISGGVIRSLVNERVLYAKTKKIGLYVGEGEVVDFIVNSPYFQGEDGKFSDKNFENFLKYQRYSEKEFQDSIKMELAGQKFANFIGDSYRASSAAAAMNYQLAESKLAIAFIEVSQANVPFTVTDAERKAFLADGGAAKVKSYYDSRKAEFSSPKKVKARHILFSHKDARNASGAAKTRTKDQAKAKAADVLAKITKAGTPTPVTFAAMAKAHTDEPAGKKSGGDLGFFTKDAMVKEFSDVAFKLKSGAVSEVVESPFGFHIIFAEAIQPAKSTDLKGATNTIADTLIKKDRIGAVVKAKADELLATAKADKAPAKPYAWQDTGAFSLTARYIPKIGMEPAILDAALTLNKAGQVYPNVLDVKGKRYIIKLKDKQISDFTKLSDEEQSQWVANSSNYDAYSLVQQYRKEFIDQAEKSGDIWISSKYRDWDKISRAARNSGS